MSRRIELLIIAIFVLGSWSAFCESNVAAEGLPNDSDERSLFIEIPYTPFNDYFNKFDPIGINFSITDSIDSATWMELDYEALNDLGIRRKNYSHRYFGIGRYDHKEITYYFLAVPLENNQWGTQVYACDETGAFTDSLYLANAIPAGGDHKILHKVREGSAHISPVDSMLYFTTTSFMSDRLAPSASDEMLTPIIFGAVTLQNGEFEGLTDLENGPIDGVVVSEHRAESGIYSDPYRSPKIEAYTGEANEENFIIDEESRRPFNDFFPEFSSLEMTFKPIGINEIGSPKFQQLDMFAIDDLDLGEGYDMDEDQYYGIGRYEFKGITYYFAAMPNSYKDSLWEVVVHVCDESGEFIDGYTIASIFYIGADKVITFGWVEYNKRRDELVFVTRKRTYNQDPDSEESPAGTLHDCEAFCLREGILAPYDKVNVDKMNKKYKMERGWRL